MKKKEVEKEETNPGADWRTTYMAVPSDVAEINTHLKAKLLRHMPQPGDRPTSIKGMVLLRREAASASEKNFENPLAAFVVQGAKLSFFGANEYFYRENQCLVAGIGMPASFKTMPATPEAPFLSVFFYLDTALIAELSAEIAQQHSFPERKCIGVKVADTDPELLEGVLRLVELLDKPEQIPIRAPLYIRDLHYLLLISPFGSDLRQINTFGTQDNNIARLISWIRQNMDSPFTLELLSSKANMSISSLHRHFKNFTGLSPLQYIKQLRLIEAQRLMLIQNERVNIAAQSVGYESVTQFNREYKRMFGNPPHRDIDQRKKNLIMYK